MSILNIKIVHDGNWSYSIFDNESNKKVFSCEHPDEVFEWLSKQGLCEIEFVEDYAFSLDDEDDVPDYEDDYNEMGFNPYSGCYDYDC